MSHLVHLSQRLSIPFWQLKIAADGGQRHDVPMSIEQAQRDYYQAQNGTDDAKALAFRRWEACCERSLAAADSYEACAVIFISAPFEGRSRAKILERWLQFTTSVKQAREVYDRSTPFIKVRNLALQKWRECSLEAINKAATLSGVMALRPNLADYEDIAIAYIEKCLSLSTLSDMPRIVRWHTNATCVTREIALRHWLDKAESEEDILEVYRHCFHHTEIKDETLRKLMRVTELVAA